MLQVKTWECMYSTGGKRDSSDSRDLIRTYGEDMIPSEDKDPKVDLRKYVAMVYDQGTLNSCTSNALCAAFCLDMKKQMLEENDINIRFFDPARLFLFYNSRAADNSIDKNTGVSLRVALKAMNDFGVCKEFLWPYEEKNFKLKPTPASYRAALGNNVCKYEKLKQDIHQLRACLKSGFPILFLMEIYPSFLGKESRRGMMVIPTEAEIESSKPLSHAVLAVGYDDTTERIIVLNSWGVEFGAKGYFFMPYKYIIDKKRTCDFWKIERICEKGKPVKSTVNI